jgi:hypothetical protein
MVYGTTYTILSSSLLNARDGYFAAALGHGHHDNRRSAFFGAQIGAQNATFQRCSPKGSNGLTASISTLKLS